MLRRVTVLAAVVLSLVLPAHADSVLVGSTTFVYGGLGIILPSVPTGLSIVAWGACPASAPQCGSTQQQPLIFDTLGNISASNSPQVFVVGPSDDPDFAAVASAISNSTFEDFGFFFTYNTDPCTGCQSPYRVEQLGAPYAINLPGVTVDYIQIIFDPFGFTQQGQHSTTIGTPTVTIEVYGSYQTTAVPEPTSVILFLSGVLPIAWRARRAITSS